MMLRFEPFLMRKRSLLKMRLQLRLYLAPTRLIYFSIFEGQPLYYPSIQTYLRYWLISDVSICCFNRAAHWRAGVFPWSSWAPPRSPAVPLALIAGYAPVAGLLITRIIDSFSVCRSRKRRFLFQMKSGVRSSKLWRSMQPSNRERM